MDTSYSQPYPAPRDHFRRPRLERDVTGAIGKHQLGRSMGQHLSNDLGYAGKQTANVQHFRDRAKECRGGVDQERTGRALRLLRYDLRFETQLSG
jgi:hypothetical protein